MEMEIAMAPLRNLRHLPPALLYFQVRVSVHFLDPDLNLHCLEV